jgi:hypothetical protein
MEQMQHRPDIAIALAQPLWVEATTPRPDGDGKISGRVIAMGWDRPQETTFYLVSDGRIARPVWVPEEDIVGNSSTPRG